MDINLFGASNRAFIMDWRYFGRGSNF